LALTLRMSAAQLAGSDARPSLLTLWKRKSVEPWGRSGYKRVDLFQRLAVMLIRWQELVDALAHREDRDGMEAVAKELLRRQHAFNRGWNNPYTDNCHVA
jgi:hypothetical protein